MKIVIVGGTSSLGSALKKVLSPLHEVITAGRTQCDLTLDLTAPADAMLLPPNVDTVIHTAAHFGGKTPADVHDAELVNVLGTLKLCQAAVRERAQHFVFISSIFASAANDSEHLTAYALSKRHAEDVARFVCSTNGLPLAVLRPSQIYGPGTRLRVHQPFLHLMMERAKNGEDILLYGTRDAQRNFIYIDDLAAVVSKAVENRLVGTYACQHPTDVTYSRIAKAALAAYGSGGSLRFLSDKPDVPDNVFPVDDALYAAIGFRPTTTIESGLSRLAQQS